MLTRVLYFYFFKIMKSSSKRGVFSRIGLSFLGVSLLVPQVVFATHGRNPISYAKASTTGTSMISDGEGGFWIVWAHAKYSSYTGDDEIYIQHMDEEGEFLLSTDSEKVIDEVGTYAYPQAVLDEKGVIFTWQDKRNGNTDVYAQRVNEKRGKVWAADAPIVTDTNEQTLPQILRVEDDVVIVWNDTRSGNTDVYAQRLDEYGSALWASNGVVVADGSGEQVLEDIVTDDDGNVYITFSDGSNPSIQKIQKLNTEGSRRFDTGIAVSTENRTMRESQMRIDKGNLFITWIHDSILIVYAQRMDTQGNRLWGSTGKQISAQVEGGHAHPQILSDGDHGAFIVWESTVFGVTNLSFQHIDENGKLLLGAYGIALTDSPKGTNSRPMLFSTWHDHLLVIFLNNESTSDPDISIKEVDRSGNVLTPDDRQNQQPVDSLDADLLRAVPDAGFGLHYTYVDYGGGLGDLFSNHAHPTGNPSFDYSTRVLATVSGAGRTTEIRTYNRYEQREGVTIRPYGSFTGGANIAVGDVNGDGKDDIVVAPRPGGGPQVHVYSQDGKLLGDFWAYDVNSRNGVRVAVGNVDGDAAEEIIVVPEQETRAHVKVYNFDAQRSIIAEWDAFGTATSGGSVAVGDIDKDGRGEVIVGAGPTGGPHVRVFEANGELKPIAFFAYHTDYRGGIDVAAGDVDGDGKAEIATVPRVGNARVKVYRYNTEQTILGEWNAYGEFPVGGRVDLVDMDYDGKAEVVTGVESGGPHVRTFEVNGALLLTDFFAFESDFRGGVDVSGGSF